MNTPNGHPHDFDASLRQLHADAVAQVSARTQAQLHQRRHAALSSRNARATPTRRLGWPLAASFAAIVALAFGVQMRQDALPAASTPTVAAAEGDGLDTTLAVLDENPDFYLWLASSDAVALASE